MKYKNIKFTNICVCRHNFEGIHLIITNVFTLHKLENIRKHLKIVITYYTINQKEKIEMILNIVCMFEISFTVLRFKIRCSAFYLFSTL